MQYLSKIKKEKFDRHDKKLAHSTTFLHAPRFPIHYVEEIRNVKIIFLNVRNSCDIK